MHVSFLHKFALRTARDHFQYIGEFQMFFSIFKCCNRDAKKLLETTMLKPDGHLLVPAQVVHLSLLELKIRFFPEGISLIIYTTNVKLKIGGFRNFHSWSSRIVYILSIVFLTCNLQYIQLYNAAAIQPLQASFRLGSWKCSLRWSYQKDEFSRSVGQLSI